MATTNKFIRLIADKYFNNPLDSELKELAIPSYPPKGMCKVYNIWYDPVAGSLTVEYNDVPETS